MYIPAAPIVSRPAPAPLPVSIGPVAPVAAAEHPLERQLLASLAGRTVNAIVIGRADDGHGIVDIGGTRVTVSAELPEAGTPVTLRFAGTAQNAAGTAATGASSTLALLRGNLPALAANNGDVRVDVGDGARSLARFTAGPLEPLALGQVDAPVDSPAEFAQALAKLLRDSGTFYESHLAAWTRGRYALDDIRREPQATVHAQSGNNAGQAQGNLPGNAGAKLLSAPQTDTPTTLPEAARNAVAASSNLQTAGGVPESLHTVLREQLHALETQTLPLQVETWPGQRAELTIGREPEQSAERGEPVPGWKTSLKLRMPGLGEVSASLTLKGDRLWLDLAAPAESAQVLEEADGSLSAAMHAAGLRLVRTRVQEQEDGDGPA